MHPLGMPRRLLAELGVPPRSAKRKERPHRARPCRPAQLQDPVQMQNRRPERDRLRLPCRTANPSCPSRPNPRPIRSRNLRNLPCRYLRNPQCPRLRRHRKNPLARPARQEHRPSHHRPQPTRCRTECRRSVHLRPKRQWAPLSNSREDKGTGAVSSFLQNARLVSCCTPSAAFMRRCRNGTIRGASHRPAEGRATKKHVVCRAVPAPKQRLPTRIIESSRQKEAAASRRRRDWWPVPSAKLRSRLPRRCTSRQK